MTANAPNSEVIREAVMLASRAPSLHNSQPWYWVAEGATLHLWADPAPVDGGDRPRRPGADVELRRCP